MLEFSLPNMSCGHCANAVTQTCKQVDPSAKVQVDLVGRTVRIETSADRGGFAQALMEAGYPPAP